jgi:membrane associated rhomboid family serine protease
MGGLGIIGLLIMVASGIMTYQGLKDESYLRRYHFQVDKILLLRQYYRLFTAGFLHTSWMHFGLNMMVLYGFGFGLEITLGTAKFALLYLGSLVGGDLFSLFVNRHRGSYSAVGASGAMSGLVFAAIALFPGMEIGMLLLPISLPSWFYGLAYVLISIYGIRNKASNVDHSAHLGGGVVGLLIALLLQPEVLQTNYLPILVVLLPALAFFALVVFRPDLLVGGNFLLTDRGLYTRDDKDNAVKRHREEELNRLLEKINDRGVDSLSPREKQRLQQLSKWWQDAEV